MPDAINHLSAFNRIAAALENLPEDDLSAIVGAINAIANKTIPVADMTPVATAITNKVIPVTDITLLGTKLDTLNTTISNLSLGGGGTNTGGGLDCDCLAEAIGKLAEKIDQMVCVIIPIANSQHQIEKSITYIMRDGPLYGIDAPPGTFIFPVPGDGAPSLPYTPWNPTTPPIGFVEPPGGMNGAGDAETYAGYRCDIAWYIVDYLMAYHEAIIAILELAADALQLLNLIELEGVSAEMSAARPSVDLVKKAGVSLAKTGVAVSLKTVLKVIGVLLEILGDEMDAIVQMHKNHLALLQLRKKAMVCALMKAEDTGKAIEGLNAAAGKFWVPTFDVGQGYGFIWGNMNAAILGDLPANLFACQAGYDFSAITGYGDIYGDGCLECNFTCDGANVIIDFDLGKQGWVNIAPPTQPLPPAPKIIDFGEAVGYGRYVAPTEDPLIVNASGKNSGLMCWKQRGTVQIASNQIRTFTQVCVKFGGHGASDNNVAVFVDGILAMQKIVTLPTDETTGLITGFYDVVSMNIEENKHADYPNENLVNGKFYGAVRVVRHASAPIGAGIGEARIFGVAFGEETL